MEAETWVDRYAAHAEEAEVLAAIEAWVEELRMAALEATWRRTDDVEGWATPATLWQGDSTW